MVGPCSGAKVAILFEDLFPFVQNKNQYFHTEFAIAHTFTCRASLSVTARVLADNLTDSCPKWCTLLTALLLQLSFEVLSNTEAFAHLPCIHSTIKDHSHRREGIAFPISQPQRLSAQG